MISSEQYELLVDYAEGILSVEKKTEVEQLLSGSAALQHELEIIQTAFSQLHNAASGEVPERYFVNFLPRLREKIDSGQLHENRLFPRLLYAFRMPAAALIVIVAAVVVYKTVKPETHSTVMYSLVNELEQNEINAVVDDVENFTLPTEVNAKNLLNLDEVSSKLNEELLSSDFSLYQTENDLLTQVDEQNVEQILTQLDQPHIE